MVHHISIDTHQPVEFVDITERIQAAVTQSGIQSGQCIIFVPHTTAGVTINENADPDVTRDLTGQMARLAPKSPDYRHAEGNSDAHVKSLLTGAEVTVFVEQGRLVLGTWQAVYLAEFDGPRSRQALVKVLAD